MDKAEYKRRRKAARLGESMLHSMASDSDSIVGIYGKHELHAIVELLWKEVPGGRSFAFNSYEVQFYPGRYLKLAIERRNQRFREERFKNRGDMLIALGKLHNAK